MWEKNTRAVVLRPRIPCDIEPREPEILGRREGETEPRRHANCDGTIIRLLRVQTPLPHTGATHAGPTVAYVSWSLNGDGCGAADDYQQSVNGSI